MLQQSGGPPLVAGPSLESFEVEVEVPSSGGDVVVSEVWPVVMVVGPSSTELPSTPVPSADPVPG